MYLTLKQQVKHLSKKEFRNLKYLSHVAKNLTNEAIYNIRQYYFNKKKYLKQQEESLLSEGWVKTGLVKFKIQLDKFNIM